MEMDHSTILIKNMVCDRCIATVQNDLQQLGLPYMDVRLGEVRLSRPLSEAERGKLSVLLESQGFQLLMDRDKQLVEQIKGIIRAWVREPENYPEEKLSEVITQSIPKDYHQLSTIFSSTQGITIEKYSINLKIEFVKELLSYDEHTLSQIAFRLRYSSLAHLSSQFKKVTGMTPSEYKSMKEKPRKPIDEV